MKRLLLIICLAAAPAHAAKRAALSIPQALLSRVEIQQLAQYARDYVQVHQARLALQRNESGFVRLSIPAPTDHKGRIEKLRLNYWMGEEDQAIEPESIHSHPRYFESLLMHGGYQHALYKKSADERFQEYENYRIFKNEKNKKKVLYMKPQILQHLGDHSHQAGDHVLFPGSLIHRVLHTQPETLSLNVVFKERQEETSYDVYLSKDARPEDARVDREILVDDSASKIITEILGFTDSFVRKA